MWSDVTAVVVSTVVAGVSLFASKQYYALKTKVSLLSGLLQTAVSALEDDTLTEEELAKIVFLLRNLVA